MASRKPHDFEQDLPGEGLSVEDLPVDAIAQELPKMPLESYASSYMSTPVRTVLSSATLGDAQAILLRYGHTGLCVVNQAGQLVGMLSRRDVEVAIRHGLSQAMVLTCMSTPVRAIAPHTSLRQARLLMATYDIGRLPVIDSSAALDTASGTVSDAFASGTLVGIITRSDILRQLQTDALNADSQSLSLNPKAADWQSTSIETADDSHLYKQLALRSGPLWPAIEIIIKAVESKGWALYVVGGAVRDLLLSQGGQVCPLTDIDLVVDGAEPGAGVTLAEAIRASYPQVDLKVYGDFQTATLTWPSAFVEESRIKGDVEAAAVTHDAELVIDIATARTEFYPYPAANPEVESSTIHQDLYRRDFTINAMAIRLDGKSRGRLLDFFGGRRALEQRFIRVIHSNSLIEDPTRIFRAVRFAVRLGFELDDYTERLIRCAVHSQIYARLQASGQKIPALQSRLTAELKSILSADYWDAALAKLNQLGALACVHHTLSLNPDLWLQLRRALRWQHQLLPEQPRWQLLLVLIIAQLLPADRRQVAHRLNLDAESQRQLKNLHRWEEALIAKLPAATRPSEIYDCLFSYSLVEQLLIVARHPYTLGPQIWHYICHLSRIPPLINGGTLKRLGYAPGPQFREILTAVHQATLNGELDTADEAEAYVLANYSVSDRS